MVNLALENACDEAIYQVRGHVQILHPFRMLDQMMESQVLKCQLFSGLWPTRI